MARRRGRGGRASLTSGPPRGSAVSQHSCPDVLQLVPPRGTSLGCHGSQTPRLIGGRHFSLAAHWPDGPPLPPAWPCPRPPGQLAPSSKGTWKCGVVADVALGGGERPMVGPWAREVAGHLALAPGRASWTGLIKHSPHLFVRWNECVPGARLSPLHFRVEKACPALGCSRPLWEFRPRLGSNPTSPLTPTRGATRKPPLQIQYYFVNEPPLKSSLPEMRLFLRRSLGVGRRKYLADSYGSVFFCCCCCC